MAMGPISRDNATRMQRSVCNAIDHSNRRCSPGAGSLQWPIRVVALDHIDTARRGLCVHGVTRIIQKAAIFAKA